MSRIVKMIHSKTIKNVSSDVILNLLASLVSTGVMQLVLYPVLAKKMGGEDYGEMLTIMGIVNIIVLALGNNLCNARIVVNEKYKKEGLIGDFQILLLIAVAIAIIAILVINAFFSWPFVLLLGIIGATVVTVLKSYYLVTYRIDINYKKNLYANVCMSLAYILGAFVLINFMQWPMVFLFASLAGLAYIWFSSGIIKEPFVKTQFFKSTGKVALFLFLSGIIGNITQYLDRFIVYPVLGGASVSYYTVASFFAKSLSLVLLPITTVLLSYIAADKVIITKKRFLIINILLLVIVFIFLIISITIGKYITALLYPTLIIDSQPYIIMASIGVVIGIAGSFNGIVVLAKAPTYWQIVLSATNLVLYFVFCYFLVLKFGLFGLCYGVIITNIVLFVINYLIGNHYLNKKK